MKLHLAVLLLSALVYYATAQYWGYSVNDDVAYDDGLQLYDNYDSEYALVPVRMLPSVYDDEPFADRARGKGKKKKKKKKGKKKGWGWGWPKIKHIWLKAPKFHAQPPVIHIHPAPKHHVHKVVHHGWGWGHGGGGGGGGYKK